MGVQLKCNALEKVHGAYRRDMDSLEFHVGLARLVSYSPDRELPWRVVFEDEGAAGYCYACNFPNFMDDGRNGWRSSDHSWDEAAMERFESAVFAAE